MAECEVDGRPVYMVRAPDRRTGLTVSLGGEVGLTVAGRGLAVQYDASELRELARHLAEMADAMDQVAMSAPVAGHA